MSSSPPPSQSTAAEGVAELPRYIVADGSVNANEHILNVIAEPGPRPDVHKKALVSLWQTWPSLGKALIDLAVEQEHTEALNILRDSYIIYRVNRGPHDQS